MLMLCLRAAAGSWPHRHNAQGGAYGGGWSLQSNAHACPPPSPLACRGSNLILSGAYQDFSPAWYADVGQSLELLIILNAVVTGEMDGWLQTSV